MQAQASPTLVLMRAGEEDGRTLFSADIYIGRSLQSSVYYTRSAMLGWFDHASETLRQAIASAMDQLTVSPDTSLREVPLASLPAFVSEQLCEAAI